MLSPSSSVLNRIPAQLLTYKEKIKNDKAWGKECVDAFEKIGRAQYRSNTRFLENYEMVNGRFIMGHYFEEEGYKDWLTELTKEFEIPPNLRHYDIIGKVVNNIVEKLAEFPDVFRVQEKYEEDATNEYVRTQTRLLHQSIQAEINREISAILAQEGFDPNKQDFASEEEAMQYFQEMQAAQTALTPPQIQRYMTTSWQSQAEIWASHQLELNKERHDTASSDRKEFRDMIFTDRCFRHFYLTGDGRAEETWNPVHTFFHVSDELEWAQDGDYVGRTIYGTKADVIDRYGWKLKAKDIKKLEEMDGKWNDNKDLSGFPQKVYAPFADYKAYTVVSNALGYDPMNNIPLMSDHEMNALQGAGPLNTGTGLIRITQVYWKSQRKIAKVVYIDPITGQLTKDIVDENFVVPEGFTQKRGDFYNGNTVNTVYWTWINEVWKGDKLSFVGSGDEDAIYIDLEPCEFQFRGDYNPFICKLPVCGRVFNNRNAQSMSLVDLMKPHQIGYNVCMNQLYQLMEKEIGKFMVWDAAFFNNMKDWGGEDSWDKVALVAKELGHVFGDTSPQNMKGANPGNQLPKVVDMDLTSQMFSRARLAEFFESRAMAQLGINPQMMGDVKATETATGINAGVSQSQMNVQKYYTDFFQYKKKCLTMSLNIDQYVQAQNKDVTVAYTKSDGSKEYIKMVGTDLLTQNIHVYIVNSQELLKQLEMMKQWVMTNNTTGASTMDVLEIIASNSPSAIKARLMESEAKMQAQQQQIQQQQAQIAEQQNQAMLAKEQMISDRNTENNDTKREIAYIQTYNRAPNPQVDADANATPDSLEYAKFNSANSIAAQRASAQNESNAIKRQQVAANTQLKSKELEIKEKALKVKEKESRDKVKIATRNKNKYST